MLLLCCCSASLCCAGAAYGQELPPKQMEEIIRLSGRVPRQRTTLYGTPAPSQVDASFTAEPLQQAIMGTSQVAAKGTIFAYVRDCGSAWS